jgi:excisionase family DNA binding protein
VVAKTKLAPTYTTEQAAELAGCCINTIRGLYNQGVLRGPRLGRRIRISESSLAQFLSGEQTGTATEAR